MKRIEQSTGKRVSPFDLARRGISAQPDSDLSEWGFPFLEEVEAPEADEGMRVIAGPDVEYRPGQWRQSWIQVPEGPEVPESITRAQAKAVLILDGLWPAVVAAVEGIESEEHRTLAEVALHDQEVWLRSSPTLLSIAAHLGLTESEIDEMFIRGDSVRF